MSYQVSSVTQSCPTLCNPVDYSTVWESLGYYAYAAQLLQKGIDLMPQEQGENKQIFLNHLTKVNDMKARFENASWMKRLLGMTPPTLMNGALRGEDPGRLGLPGREHGWVLPVALPPSTHPQGLEAPPTAVGPQAPPATPT